MENNTAKVELKAALTSFSLLIQNEHGDTEVSVSSKSQEKITVFGTVTPGSNPSLEIDKVELSPDIKQLIEREIKDALTLNPSEQGKRMPAKKIKAYEDKLDNIILVDEEGEESTLNTLIEDHEYEVIYRVVDEDELFVIDDDFENEEMSFATFDELVKHFIDYFEGGANFTVKEEA